MGIKSGKKIIIAFNYLLFIIVLTQKDIQYVSLEDEKKLKIKINEFYKIGKEYFNNFYS